jgi:hypothetical protein
MKLVPVDREQARRFVNEHHRHNEAPLSWKFGVGLENGEAELVGVAMAGRPKARGLDQLRAVEVERVCVLEGHRNACSMLYGAVCRAAAALGYEIAYTYTLASEDAASVKAAGFVLDAELADRSAGEWGQSRARYQETLFGARRIPSGPKHRWRRELIRRSL